jgi:hypothetical protein
MYQVWGKYVSTSWEVNCSSEGLATLPFDTLFKADVLHIDISRIDGLALAQS